MNQCFSLSIVQVLNCVFALLLSRYGTLFCGAEVTQQWYLKKHMTQKEASVKEAILKKAIFFMNISKMALLENVKKEAVFQDGLLNPPNQRCHYYCPGGPAAALRHQEAQGVCSVWLHSRAQVSPVLRFNIVGPNKIFI